MLHEWVAGKCSSQKQKHSSLFSLVSKRESFLEILRFCGYVQEEFGTLKPWYDHFGGDAIGLTWNKHNSKVKKKRLFSYFKQRKSKQMCNVQCILLQKREREDDEDEINPIDMLKAVGKMGKGLVRDIYLLKSPRLS